MKLIIWTLIIIQVGMMLKGMGFDNNTSIYLAAGKIYKGEKNMLPLKQMFPLLQTKESLATTDELTPFKVPCVRSQMPGL